MALSPEVGEIFSSERRMVPAPKDTTNPLALVSPPPRRTGGEGLAA
jgi:hypothetical protein